MSLPVGSLIVQTAATHRRIRITAGSDKTKSGQITKKLWSKFATSNSSSSHLGEQTCSSITSTQEDIHYVCQLKPFIHQRHDMTVISVINLLHYTYRNHVPIQYIKASCFVTKSTGRHAEKITDCVQNRNENGIMVECL